MGTSDGYLQHLAHRVGVALAQGVRDHDLVPDGQGGHIPEDVVAQGARVADAVSGYVGAGAGDSGVARTEHVARARRE